MIQMLFAMLGRIAISLTFLYAAFNQILDWQEAIREMGVQFADWETQLHQLPSILGAIKKISPFTPLLLAGALFLKVIGGISVLFGFKAKQGAFFLLIVLVPGMLIEYPFWEFFGDLRAQEMRGFLQQLAIAGGLLYIMGASPGMRRSGSDFNRR